jgi:hypothetical protein
MGYGHDQSHRFLCHHCNEPIAIELPSERNGHRWVLTGADEAEQTEVTTYQYLSSDFVADEKQARNPLYFGAMELMDKLSKSPQGRQALSSPPTEPGWVALTDAPIDWAVLSRCWRLERAGKWHLAAEQLNAYAQKRDEDSISAWLSVLTFTEKLFGVDDDLMNSVTALHEQHSSEFARLVVAYENEWKSDLREGHFHLFTEFFKNWKSFAQVYLYVQAGIDLPKPHVATSVDYEEVRGFYARAQEFYGNQLVLLTALNNVKEGRPFDSLKNISLTKYRNTDNAKRRDNFAGNAAFVNVSTEYDSRLRNAEVHNWVTSPSDGQTLLYKIGGDGAEVRLSYVLYLLKCVSLFRQICLLMHVEYLLGAAARAAAAERLFRAV